MPIDTSMYQQFLRPAPTVAEDLGTLNQLGLQRQQQAQNQLALASGQQKLDEYTREVGEKNALRDALSRGLDITTQAGQNKLYQIALTQAPGILKTMQDQMTARSTAAKNNADAGATDYKTQQAKADKAMSTIANFQTPADALASLNDQHAQGVIGDQQYQQVLSALQASSQTPQAFSQWKRQTLLHLLDVKEQIAATAPKVTMTNTGGAIVPVNENADAGPVGQMAGVAPIKTTATPGEQLAASTSRANTKDTIAKDLQVAGMSQDGTLSPAMEAMAQGISKGEIAPLSGFALAKPGGQALMGRVMAINPSYDATTYGAKAQAAKAFTSGTQGNALRSIATANNHLDQLGGLVDALDNGNNQTVNQVANAVAAWNGGTAPTNFDAVKNIVGQEVVKAIVAGGGSANERDEAAKTFSTMKAPSQLKEAIAHYRMIMGAQQSNLLEQRRAAGLPDSTLPNYGGGSAAPAAIPAAPSGFVITHIDGKPQ